MHHHTVVLKYKYLEVRALICIWKMGNSQSDDSKWRAGFIFHNVSRQTLEPGDHIYVYRKGGLYNHHGIYISEEEVIHFVDKSLSLTTGKKDPRNREGVFCDSLDDFLEGGTPHLVTYNETMISTLFKRSETSHGIKSREALL